MNNSRKIATITLMSLTLLSNTPPVLDAKIMSGSISEKKQNAKVAKMLTSARKSASKGKNQDAINTYWKILELDSQEPYAHLELGEIYKKLRIYDRSIEMLTSGLELGEKELDNNELCNYYCILTEAYIATHQQGLANKSLIKAAEISPRNPMPRKILGDIYLKNNRVANAAKAYKKALELDPYFDPATKALNELKLEYGDKLPKEDKDKDYIKKVAVKLADPNKDNNKTKPSEETKPQDSESNKISTTADSSIKESNSTDIESQTNTSSEEVDINDTNENIDETEKIVNDNRPIPVDAKELAKMAKEKEKKRKKQDANKPKTAEEIEKAMAEKEALMNSSQEEKSKNEEQNQHYLDMFLAGNPTEKEEALNYFINQGKPGLEQIEELIYDSDPNVRIMAIRALPLFDDYKEEVKIILDEASEDSTPEIVEEINKALSLL